MNKSLSLLAILLIGGITFANALDNPNKMVVVKNGSTFRLLYKGAEQSDVKVLILNDDNQIVYTEKIKNTDGFARPYNFSNMPEGHYSIQIRDNAGVSTEMVSHQIKKEEKTIHLLRLNGTGKYVLSVPSQEKQDLSIMIFNDMNEVLYQSDEKISGDFARIYDLRDETSKFRFVVTDEKGLTKSVTK